MALNDWSLDSGEQMAKENVEKQGHLDGKWYRIWLFQLCWTWLYCNKCHDTWGRWQRRGWRSVKKEEYISKEIWVCNLKWNNCTLWRSWWVSWPRSRPNPHQVHLHLRWCKEDQLWRQGRRINLRRKLQIADHHKALKSSLLAWDLHKTHHHQLHGNIPRPWRITPCWRYEELGTINRTVKRHLDCFNFQ